MNEIIQEKYGSFLQSMKKLSYTLNDNQLFSLNQYKICNNQTQDLFVKCQKIQHNGKVRILYFTEEYENILDVVKEINERDYYKICENLIHEIIQIKDNGFLNMHNVILEPNMIYLEKDTLKIKFIYIPITSTLDKNCDIEEVIKNVLLKITDKILYSKLYNVLETSNLNEIQKWFKKEKNEKENYRSQKDEYYVINHEEFLEKEETRTESFEKKSSNSGKTIGIVSGIILIGIVLMCYVVLKGKETSINVAVPTPKITMTPTPTLEPTATPTPTPTAIPTPEPTVTPTPQSTVPPKTKKQKLENTPVLEQPIENNVAPPQQPQTQSPVTTQESNQEEDYGEYDEIIIIQ